MRSIFIILFFIAIAMSQETPPEKAVTADSDTVDVKFVDFITIGTIVAVPADSLATMTKVELDNFNRIIYLLKNIYPLRPDVVQKLCDQYIPARIIQKYKIRPKNVNSIPGGQKKVEQ